MGNKVITDEDYIICKDPYGNYVTTRQLHDKLLLIMDEIHRVCVKNNIPYALIAGSALGIYNYEGFIPWDDDIDMCVPEEYWDKFLNALDKDLDSSKFYYHSYDNDKRYNVLIPNMKVRLKNTFCLEKNEYFMPYRTEGSGVFVDVVKYTGVSTDIVEDQSYRDLIRKEVLPLCAMNLLHMDDSKLKDKVTKISEDYAKNNVNSPLVSQPISIPWDKKGKEPIFKREDVYPFKLYNFEGRKFYSYNNLEKVLIDNYGINALRYYDENSHKWIDPFPQKKRSCKHYLKINLNGPEFKK